MLELCTLFSGSDGNCAYISDGETRLLVDCGVSGKKIENGLKQIGVRPDQINGVLVTHEHNDHIASVGILHRRFGWKLYANEGTWRAAESAVGAVDDSCLYLFDQPFQIGQIRIVPFSVPHDAADPVGFRFFQQNSSVTVATDLGIVTPEVEQNLLGSDVVLLESNHDEEMLKMGPYPYSLKRRILGDSGHLSNENAGKLCVRLAEHGTKKFLLGHLSHRNNIPELAYQTVVSVFRECAVPGQVDIRVAPRDRNSVRYTAGS